MGSEFVVAHGEKANAFAYAAIAPPSSSNIVSFAFIFKLSLFYERTYSRHAPQVSQPTSKPGRPHRCVNFNYIIESTFLYNTTFPRIFILCCRW